MKTLLIFLVVFLLSCSDNKEKKTDSVESLRVTETTKFGVLVHGKKQSTADKARIAKSLGALYIRDAITMSTWKGKSRAYEDNVKDFKILLNINYGQQQAPDGTPTPVPFPKDTVAYKKVIDAILTKYKPELVVVENEPTNKGYHSGPISDYVNELRAAVTVCKSKGVPVVNGGLHPQGLCILVYRDYVARGLVKEAENFMANTFNPAMKGVANYPGRNKAYESYVGQCDTLIKAYKTIGINYLNVHLYEPVNNFDSDPFVLKGGYQEIVDYIYRMTGLRTMTNEFGQDNADPELTTNILKELQESGFVYAIYFSGDGDNGEPTALTDLNGNLRATGTAFKKYITNQ